MGKFDESWKEVFKEAEVSPSESVWINIDRDIANAEGELMKKRVVFYQRIAAASILFALFVGSFAAYRWRESTVQLAENKSLKNELGSPENQNQIEKKKEVSSAQPGDKESLAATRQEKATENPISSLKPDGSLTRTNPSANSRQAITKTEKRNQGIKESGQLVTQSAAIIPEKKKDDSKINPFSAGRKFFEMAAEDFGGLDPLPIPEIHAGPLMVDVFRKLPAIPGAFMDHKEKKLMHEQVWASVTAAAGSYNANSYSNYNLTAGNQVSPSGYSTPVGSSYSFGMLAGIRVSNRVVLQSGVQYMNQSIGTSSNISSSGSLSPVANYASSPSAIYTTTFPYNITSANEFVSVPVQAGYLIIDKKVGFQLNSGVSTDFFVRNTLSDPSGQRQSYSQGAGQDSPYRSVNFSGLMSSEMSYKLGSHYRVSLVPGFRYSFSPVLKSATGTGNPWVWDVGFRFRYIFK